MKWLKLFSIPRLKYPHTEITDNSQETKSKTLYPSLDLAFDLTKESINAQLQSVDALDTKANFAIGAATAVVSAALVLQSLLLPSHPHSNCTMIVPQYLHVLPSLVRQTLPFLPLLLTYLIAVVFAFRAYRASNLYTVPTPSKLLDNLDKSESDIKASMFRAMVEVHRLNKNQIDKKASLINNSLLCLVLETLSLILLVLYQVGC